MARGKRKTCGVHVNINWLYIDYCWGSVMNTWGFTAVSPLFFVFIWKITWYLQKIRGGEKNRESRKRRNRRGGDGGKKEGDKEEKRMDQEKGRRGGGGKRRPLGWRKGETGSKQRRWSQLPGITCQTPTRAKGHRHEQNPLMHSLFTAPVRCFCWNAELPALTSGLRVWLCSPGL